MVECAAPFSYYSEVGIFVRSVGLVLLLMSCADDDVMDAEPTQLDSSIRDAAADSTHDGSPVNIDSGPEVDGSAQDGGPTDADIVADSAFLPDATPGLDGSIGMDADTADSGPGDGGDPDVSSIDAAGPLPDVSQPDADTGAGDASWDAPDDTGIAADSGIDATADATTTDTGVSDSGADAASDAGGRVDAGGTECTRAGGYCTTQGTLCRRGYRIDTTLRCGSVRSLQCCRPGP